MKGFLGLFSLHYVLILIASAIARISFIILNFSSAPSFFSTLPSFYYGLPLDLSVASYLLLPALLIFFFLEKDKLPKGLKIFYLVAGIVIFIVNHIDAELFADWGSRINIMALFYVQNVKGASASVSFGMILKFAIGLTVQTVLFLLIIKYLIGLWSKSQNLKKQISIASISLLMVMLSGAFVLLRGGLGKVPINQSRAVFSSNPFLNASAINGLWNFFYYIFDSGSDVKYEDFKYFEESEIEDFLENNLDKGKELEPALFSNKKPNIILLTMESLSAETFVGLGGRLDWSPKMNSILEKSLVFRNMYSSGNRTDKGIVALLSGFPAQPTTSILKEPQKSSKLPSISCNLANENYQNTFIYGGDISFANMNSYIRSICFDKIIDEKNIISKTAKGSWGYHDQDIFNELKQELENQNSDKPFFINVLSLSVHDPFDVPTKRQFLNKIENSYRYSDSCVFDFLQWFEQSKYFENTVVIITGDHGRDLEFNELHFWDKYKFHIPAILYGGAVSKSYIGKQFENACSQTALMPFILQNIGMPVSDFEFYNNPIFDNIGTLYFFDNGIGFVNNNKSFLIANETGEVNYIKPSDVTKDSCEKEKTFSQKYLQTIMKKYFDLNLK